MMKFCVFLNSQLTHCKKNLLADVWRVACKKYFKGGLEKHIKGLNNQFFFENTISCFCINITFLLFHICYNILLFCLVNINIIIEISVKLYFNVQHNSFCMSLIYYYLKLLLFLMWGNINTTLSDIIQLWFSIRLVFCKTVSIKPEAVFWQLLSVCTVKASPGFCDKIQRSVRLNSKVNGSL